MTASDGPPFAARISALFAMLAPCLKALSVRSFKITDWARGLMKNTDYDLRSFGVHRSEYPALRSRSLVIAKVTNWLVKIHADESLVIPVLQRNRRTGCDKEQRHRVLIHEF